MGELRVLQNGVLDGPARTNTNILYFSSVRSSPARLNFIQTLKSLQTYQGRMLKSLPCEKPDTRICSQLLFWHNTDKGSSTRLILSNDLPYLLVRLRWCLTTDFNDTSYLNQDVLLDCVNHVPGRVDKFVFKDLNLYRFPDICKDLQMRFSNIR